MGELQVDTRALDGVVDRIDFQIIDVDVTRLFTCIPAKKNAAFARNAYAPPALQTVTRDFAFLVDAALPAGDLLRAIKGADKANIVAARDFFPTDDDKSFILILDDAPGQALTVHMTRPHLALTLDQKWRLWPSGSQGRHRLLLTSSQLGSSSMNSSLVSARLLGTPACAGLPSLRHQAAQPLMDAEGCQDH